MIIICTTYKLAGSTQRGLMDAYKAGLHTVFGQNAYDDQAKRVKCLMKDTLTAATSAKWLLEH